MKSVVRALTLCALAASVLIVAPPPVAAHDEPYSQPHAEERSPIRYRVTAGGRALAGDPPWSGDRAGTPSPYVNAGQIGDKAWTSTAAMDTSDPSVPPGTPAAVFASTRWDPATAPEMRWRFPVEDGRYELRLYFAENNAQVAVGKRIFDVLVEGQLAVDDLDVRARAGGVIHRGIVVAHTVEVTDGSLDAEFRRVASSTMVQGLEVIHVAPLDGCATDPGGEGCPTGCALEPLECVPPTDPCEPEPTAPDCPPADTTTTTTSTSTSTTEPPTTTTSEPPPTTTSSTTTSTSTTTTSSTTTTTSSTTTTTSTTLPPPPTPDPDRGTWDRLADSAHLRSEQSFVAARGRFYLAGGVERTEGTGVRSIEEYDPSTGRWRTVGNLLDNVNHAQAVEVGGLVYFLGGLAKPDSVQVFDPVTYRVTRRRPMPRPRGAGGVVEYGGKLYYAGGRYPYEDNAKNWFDEYDPTTDTWRQMPPMPRYRDHFHTAMIGDRMYVLGGRNVTREATIAATDVYDFSEGRWLPSSTFAPIPVERGGHSVAVLGPDILVFGGEVQSQDPSLRSVLAYRPSTDNWRSLPNMIFGDHGIQAVACGGAFYIAAGADSRGSKDPSRHLQRFTPAGATGCGPGRA